MAGDFIIRNDGNVNQRESAAVEFSCQRRIIKLIQPPGGVRIRAAFTRIEQHGYHQWQLLYGPPQGGAAWQPPHNASGEKPCVYRVKTGAQ